MLMNIMSEYLREPERAKRVFARSEMNSSPLKDFLASTMESGHIRDVDVDYAVSHLTAGAKAHFFWPKFLIGTEPAANWEETLGECVDMFLFLYKV